MSKEFWDARVRAYPVMLAAMLVLVGSTKVFPSWYEPKETGFGVRPVTWQGWALSIVTVVTAVWIVRATRVRK